jgi:SpoVK/Ycf46/Vps4 family AAA+-type ATPase
MATRRRRALPAGLATTPFAPALRDYAHNLLVGTPLRSLDASALRRASGAGLLSSLVRGAAGETGAEPWAMEPDDLAKLRDALRAYLCAHGRARRHPRPPAQPVAANLRLLGDVLGLDPEQRALLQFVIALHACSSLKELTSIFGEVTLPDAASLVAAAIGAEPRAVLRALSPSGRLVESGIVSVDESDCYPLPGKIELKRGILDTLLTPGVDRRGLVARFLPELAPNDLAWDDFTHVEASARIARDLLAAALRAGRGGANVLLHGPTGTGKTALASLLAREIGAPLYVAGRSNEHGESATARERLASLLLGQRLVPRGASLLLFDELEDLFPGAMIELLVGSSRTAAMSKQWFNQLLESNPVPTLWISNRIEGVDPAFLRRFAYTVELSPLGPRQRSRVLGRHLGVSHRLSRADVEAVAERFRASPAQLGAAVATARLLAADGRPDRAALEQLLGPAEKLLTGVDPRRRHAFDAASYDVAGLASSEDLAGLAARLADWKAGDGRGLSLCLSGPPGTGKTELVRYLAHRMGRRVLHRRPSDLLSQWVGETEQRIAAAFRQAEDEDLFLLFDEADTFLRDRRGAGPSWERSQVNEFLQQLESYRGVVACTTNLREELDEAALRRFVLKIELRFLDPERALALFRARLARHLATPPSADDEAHVRRELGRLPRLAPGDFAAVERRLAALRTRVSVRDLVAALRAEVDVKPRARRAAGF